MHATPAAHGCSSQPVGEVGGRGGSGGSGGDGGGAEGWGGDGGGRGGSGGGLGGACTICGSPALTAKDDVIPAALATLLSAALASAALIASTISASLPGVVTGAVMTVFTVAEGAATAKPEVGSPAAARAPASGDAAPPPSADVNDAERALAIVDTGAIRDRPLTAGEMGEPNLRRSDNDLVFN